jgi:histidine triad (HIT) family protein
VSDCLFCKIVADEIPSDKVLGSHDVTAFRDINPAAPVHVLVIPNEHISSVDALGPGSGELLEALFEAVRQVVSREGLEDGYRVVTNIGRDGGQTVPHLHLHVLGGRALAWPPG